MSTKTASHKYIGAHVSAAGGVHKAPQNARAIGARAFALFVKNQRQWEGPPLTEAQAALFRKACEESGYGPARILPHAGYLINLANPDRAGLQQSRGAFVDELRRCGLLGLSMLNVHPGSHRRLVAEETALAIVADSVNGALDKTSGVTVVLENTAGQGGYVGHTFEQLAAIVDRIDDKSRLGVCLDTCHLFAAGRDLGTRDAYESVMRDFDRTVGFGLLRALHLNDSKGAMGSHLDRHEPLGDGLMGLEPFRLLMNDPRLDGLPMILETTDPTRWEREIELLYSLEEGTAAETAAGGFPAS